VIVAGIGRRTNNTDFASDSFFLPRGHAMAPTNGVFLGTKVDDFIVLSLFVLWGGTSRLL